MHTLSAIGLLSGYCAVTMHCIRLNIHYPII